VETSPSPSVPYQPIDVPDAPAHAAFVPADLFVQGAQPPIVIHPQEAMPYVYTSVEGLGWPLPPGGAYNLDSFEQIDAPSYTEGYIESLVATQWACWWLSERETADEAGDDATVDAVETLLGHFWQLPHIEYLTADGLTYRDQLLAEVNGDETLLLDRMWSFGCGGSTP